MRASLPGEVCIAGHPDFAAAPFCLNERDYKDEASEAFKPGTAGSGKISYVRVAEIYDFVTYSD